MKRKTSYYIFKLVEYLKIYICHFFSFIQFVYWGVVIGKKVRFYGLFKLVNMNKMSIGDNTRINSGFRNFVSSYSKCSFWVGQNGNIEIGENVGISNATIISENHIKICSDVLIGGGTKIYDNDFHPLTLNERKSNPNKISSSPIIINQGVFIGGHCTILKGVEIGPNAVVGASSLVCNDIPANEVWGGVPAKKIR